MARFDSLTQPFLRFRWDRQTHTHTHKTTTVTLAAHAHRGLIMRNSRKRHIWCKEISLIPVWPKYFCKISDHKPLTAILGLKKVVPFLAAARLQRWAVCLSTSQYDITFKPTGEHANADGLTHLPLRLTKPAANHHATNKISAFNQAQIDTLPLTASQIAKATRQD